MLLLCILTLLSIVAETQALTPSMALDRYARQAWSTENGLPQNSVHSLLQTKDGLLWIGTEGGLARFDGYQFKVFDRASSPALPGDDIRCLLEDDSGGLWVGTASGLVRLKGGSVSVFTMAEKLPIGAVEDLASTPDGHVWALTSSGLISAMLPKDETSAITFALTASVEGDMPRSIATDGAGGLWVAGRQQVTHAVQGQWETVPSGLLGPEIESIGVLKTEPGTLYVVSSNGLFRVHDGNVTTVASGSALPSGGVRQLLPTPEGVWAAGRNSVSYFPLKAAVRPSIFSIGSGLPGTQVTRIFADTHGAVWIGTNGGVARFRNGRMKSSAAAGEAVLALLEDRDGDLWVGTETHGVKVLRDRTFQLLDPAMLSSEAAPTSVVQSADGDIWVGTSGAGVIRAYSRRAHSSASARKAALARETILALAAGGQDSKNLWVGTTHGLELINGDHEKTFTSADGLADDLVRSLLPSRDGSLWIGTQHGLTNLRAGHATTFTTAQGLGSNLIGPMLEAADGDLWIGTFGGLSRLRNGALNNFSVADGLPGNTVTALAAGTGGGLWIGTKGHGLAMWDGSRVRSFAAARSVPAEIYSLQDDGAGSLWMTSEHGIFRASTSDLSSFLRGESSASDVPVVTYGTGDGLPSVDTATIGYPLSWRLRDGRLCFVTRRGVVVVDPTLTKRDPSPPPVVLEDVAIDDHAVTPLQMASLAPGPLHFAFAYAGIDLSAPQRVQYRYKLEGLDKDWTYAGARRVAYYTSIPHGRYRFRISARHELGAWSEPVDLAFELRPHVYQTLWFRALLALLMLALGLALYHVRVRGLRTRFNLISAERNRLAREIHDTLAQSFVAVSMRLEMMSQTLKAVPPERPQELPARLTDQLNQTRALVRDSIEEARRSIWDLRSEGADAQSLPARLARVVHDASARGPLARLETTGTFRPLEQPLEDELYRIAQEAVNNCVRHAQAKSIWLRLGYQLDSLWLEVVDDGQGFDSHQVPSPQSGHYGLTGMRERARLLSAEFMLESVAGEGTTLRVTLPLPQNGKHPKRHDP